MSEQKTEGTSLESFTRAKAVVAQVEEFLAACKGENAPVDCFIVYRNADGSFGYCAPAGDGIEQVGMLATAQHVLLSKMARGG